MSGGVGGGVGTSVGRGVSGGTGGTPNPTAAAASARPGDVPQPSGPKAPLRVGGPIKPPRKTYEVPATYPDDARAARVQGVVVLDVTIAKDGTVADAVIKRSIPMLDQAAIDAVRQWRFEPTLLNGAPIEVLVTITVNFSLR